MDSKRLLELLQKDGRQTPARLAVLLGASEQEVCDEIARLEKEGVVLGYPALIDWDKTEREAITALIEVKVTPQRGEGFDSIAERIYRFPEVTGVYLMSGGFDLTVFIEGKSIKEVAMFVSGKLAAMEGVLSTATHFVLKKYKENGIFMESEKKDERMLVSP